jgi:D-3-phosphoglycerate dehydrogenase / 2-oxoglutarate reductase
MHKVLISDKVHDNCRKILEDAGVVVDYRPGLSEEELHAALEDCTGLIVRSQTKATADVIAAGKNLSVIGRAGVGVDNIDIEAATRRGIAVINTPEGNTISAAEQAVALMCALARNIPQAHYAMKHGEWNRSAFTGTEISGKTLGVIGLGKIGREVAKRARGLNMEIICFDPLVSSAAAEAVGAQLMTLDELLQKADYITLHVPDNERTHHMMNTEAFAKCKKGVRVVNCARGGIIDDDALFEALESGQVAGAALDVFSEEPPNMDSALIQHDKVIVTPHLGASTAEAQQLVAEQIGQLIADALVSENIRNAVNMIPLDRATYLRAQPFIELCAKLGRLQAQIIDGQPVSLTMQYFGDALEHPTGLLTSSLLMGLMRELETGAVNLVNAPVLAQERGIRVDEMRTTGHEDYSNLITVELTYETASGEQQSRSLAGSIFGEDSQRVVRIDGYTSDLIPEGHVIIIWNSDVPGVIGEVATALGDHGVNIAFGSFAREKPGGMALTVYVLDSEVDEATLKDLDAMEHVHRVKYAQLA